MAAWGTPSMFLIIGAIQYGYEQKYSHEENSLYRLDQLAGWGAGANHEFSVLPSIA